MRRRSGEQGVSSGDRGIELLQSAGSRIYQGSSLRKDGGDGSESSPAIELLLYELRDEGLVDVVDPVVGSGEGRRVKAIQGIGIIGNSGATTRRRQSSSCSDSNFWRSKEDLFTIEMHFNGIFIGTDYLYGSVAWFDRVDPDYLSLIELNGMADLVNVEGDFFQYMWPRPEKGTADGLLCIECEADVLAFNKAWKNIDDDGSVLGAPFTVMKLYVKKLSEFEARKRIGQIKMELHRAAFQRRIQFRLEEINADEDVQVVSDTPGGTGSGSENKGILMLPWTAPLDFIVDNSEMASDGIVDSGGEVHPTTKVVIDEENNDKLPTHEVGDPHKGDTNFNVEFRGSEDNEQVNPEADAVYTEDNEQVNPETDAVFTDDCAANQPLTVNQPDVAVNQPDVAVNQPDVAVNQTDGRRWLDVDEVLAEMEREEALNEHVPDYEEGWSSPTIPNSPDTPGELWDGRYNPYSTEDDSDFAYVAQTSSPSSADYGPPTSSNESSSDSNSDGLQNILERRLPNAEH
ncbi:hypothetical protein LINPERHAP2_LOCUS5570 [Linum perenne]